MLWTMIYAVTEVQYWDPLKVDQPFRCLLTKILKKIVEGSAQRADRLSSRGDIAGDHGCGRERVAGNRWWCFGIATNSSSVLVKSKRAASVGTSCLNDSDGGWMEDHMAMTWCAGLTSTCLTRQLYMWPPGIQGVKPIPLSFEFKTDVWSINLWYQLASGAILGGHDRWKSTHSDL